MGITDPQAAKRSDTVGEFLITHSFPPEVGGLETYWRNVISNSGRPFDVLTNPLPSGTAEVSFPNLRQVIRQKLWAWPWLRPSWLPWWWRLPSLVQNKHPRHIHLGHYSPLSTIVTSRLGQYPLVVYLHGTDVREGLKTPNRQRQFVATISRAKKVIVNSEYLRQYIVSKTGLPSSSFTVVYPGIETARFVTDQASQTDFLNKNKLSAGKFFVTVSRLIKQKGIDTAIKAFAEVAARQPDFHYCIFGEGPEKESLQALVASLQLADRVHFLGVLSHEPGIKASYLSAARAVIMSTSKKTALAESFGLVALEAQASGVPLVTSDAGGTAEAIIDGVTGFVCPADNVPALAGTLQQLAEQATLASAVGQAGQKHVQKNFAITIMTKTLTQLWDES